MKENSRGQPIPNPHPLNHLFFFHLANPPTPAPEKTRQNSANSVTGKRALSDWFSAASFSNSAGYANSAPRDAVPAPEQSPANSDSSRLESEMPGLPIY